MKTDWTKSEVKKLCKLFATNSNKELSEIFDRSEKSIIGKANSLGLHKECQAMWNNEEYLFLVDHYNKDMTPIEISKELNRSVFSIKSKAFSIGLSECKMWNKDEIDYLIDNYMYKTNEEIGKKIGRTGESVSYKAWELALKLNVDFTDDEINILKINYLNKTISELQNLLPGRTKGEILAVSHNLGLTRTRKSCQRDFFHNIDTEEKAYWLGFIFADGYIFYSDKNFKKGQISTSYGVGIKIKWSDNEHLKKFNVCINGNYQVIKIINKVDDFRKTTTEAARITVYSKQMYDDLNVFFDREKTYTCGFPSIPDNLIRHFIRGYFDGEGCFTFTDKTFNIEFVSASEKFYNGLCACLIDNGFNCTHRTVQNDYDTMMHVGGIHKNKERIKFLDWIYSECNVYLDRKYNKYLQVKEKYTTI